MTGSLEYRREGYEKDIRDIVEYFERNCRTKEKPIFGERYGYSKTTLDSNEFEPRLKSAKNLFQLSAGLNLETLNTILCGTNHI